MPSLGFKWSQERKDKASTNRLNFVDKWNKKYPKNKWGSWGGRKQQFFGACKIKGCKKPYCAKGLCRAHYIHKYKRKKYAR